MGAGAGGGGGIEETGGLAAPAVTLTLPAEEESSPSLSYRGEASPAAPCTFMCFRSDDGCVYDLSHPCTRQL